jgi:pilus assembly protein Flp/PilA
MLKSVVVAQNFLRGLLNRDDRGATAVEYGLLIALIAVVVAVGAAVLGTNLSSVFNTVATKVTATPTS